MTESIRPLTLEDATDFAAHYARHRAESGRGDHHFMPFAPDDPDGPTLLIAEGLALPMTAPGWQRWFVAVTARGSIVGHVDLKGSRLKTGMHRCLLGIGIERGYRRRGLGRRLMTAAIEFARSAESLSWVDLAVFANNAPARALYKTLGFVEIGTLEDRFRIEGLAIDDVMMSLKVD